MHSFFARHAFDKDSHAQQWNSNTDPSAGFIAWLLWDGDEGKTWTDRNATALACRCDGAGAILSDT